MLKKVHNATIWTKQDGLICCRSPYNAPEYHFFNKNTKRHERAGMVSIAVNVIHFNLSVVHEIIIRELNSIKFAILKHIIILPHTARSKQQEH